MKGKAMSALIFPKKMIAHQEYTKSLNILILLFVPTHCSSGQANS